MNALTPRDAIVQPPIASPPAFTIAENDCLIVSNDAVNAEYRLLIAEAPAIALTAKPGQFFHLACPSVGEDHPFLRRPMSIYQVNRGNGQISFLYKVQGAGTRGLASLKAGEHLDALGPLGHGFTLPEGVRHVLLLARGVGLATLAPLAAAAVAAGATVTAVLSARSPDLVMSEDYLQASGARTIVVTDKDGTSSLDELECELRVQHLALPFDYIATCGSNRLLGLVQQLGREWQIPGQVALEQQMACGTGMCFACVRSFRAKDGTTDYLRVCWDGPVFNIQEAMPWSI